ncbi:TonB-dependent receptor [Myroides sp. 1354]|uniref:TonB-dependent receptor n=1 Tax=unclassified Myroides TaxID=2642485 RepID=UPI0025770E32|nr:MULTISPECIES: TonB-dependent receptor [unclassified Myroides]MDM1044774.1 TonB-dependent receptor [Myroides sp. R163-1]MDM1055487.1 TonB-dependent receptor [Myroides sp. 1354]MDM1068784.1 TonB-dependent receptor [Myroides sp. 1372]
MKQIKILTFVSSVLFVGTAVAQDKNKSDLGTEVVDVVRRYDATVSEAFKVREVPNLDEDVKSKKKEVIYTITSFPVASTFVPTKGEAAKVEAKRNLERFDNYALFAIGNYTNINGELFLSSQIDPDSYIAGFVNHFSSQGGIKNLLLDDDFSKTKAGINFSGQKKKIGWNTEVGGSYQTLNWYGLPQEEMGDSIPQSTVVSINPKQKYKSFYFDGSVSFEDLPIKGIDVYYNNFSDDFDRAENHFVFKPRVETAIDENIIGKLNVVVDYVSSDYKKQNFFDADGTVNFANNSIQTVKLKDQHFTFGAEPSVVFKGDDYFVQLGVGLYYNNGKVGGNSDNVFKFYPQVKASYNLVPNIVIAYAGIDGNLTQNTFKDFVDQNPFVSPEAGLLPTDKTYDFYAGMKGKLDHTVSYNVKASYRKENDKALFISTPYSSNVNRMNYLYGNAMDVVYAEVETFNLFGELRFDLDNTVIMGIRGEYNHYKSNAGEAWGLPDFKVGADVLINFTDQWFAGVDLQYVGERKDWFVDQGYGTDAAVMPKSMERKVDGYADLSLKVGYRPTKNWTVFLKGNNLLNENYNQWGSFKSQGIQVMGGAIYKFDF